MAEVAWAQELDFGPLRLSDVPVTEANKRDVAWGFSATFGLAALKRLDIVIDGPRGVAYLREPPK